MYRAELGCLEGCDGVRFALDEPVYRCPRCGGLLDVVHDVEALRARSPDAWWQLFDERMAHGPAPLSSGVWGKHEWIAPELPLESIVTMDEGRTALLPARAYSASIGLEDLRLKLCGNSHTGSFKDLGMTVLVSVVAHAVKRGARSIRALGCASTGDTSAALAAYGAAAGLPVVVLLPRGKVSTAQLVQPIAAGARVLALDTDFDGCMKIIERLASEGVLYLANSMNALRLEGQKTVVIEICQQLGRQVPEWLVLPSGNLGNGYAMYAGFRLLKELGLVDRLPRLVLAQAANANPLYRAFQAQRAIEPIAARPTAATAIQIGDPVSGPRALRALAAMDGIVEQATEDELADAAARADRTGLYVCPHTAVALAATEKLVRAGTIARDERVVVISTANALKFTEFKVRYHESKLPEATSRFANPPLELPADYDTVRAAILA